MKIRVFCTCMLLVFTMILSAQVSGQDSKNSFSNDESSASVESGLSPWESSGRVEFIMSEIKWNPKRDKAYLEIVLKLKDGFRVSSLKQEAESTGGFATEIQIDSSDQFKLSGQFESVEPPLRDTTSVEIFGFAWLYHEKKTVWRAEIDVADEIDIEDLVVVGKLRFVALADDS